MTAPLCKCGCGETVERRSYETDRQWEKRSKLGIFRDKCKKNLPAHPSKPRPLPTLELVSLCYEVGDGRVQPKEKAEEDTKYRAFVKAKPCLIPGCCNHSEGHHQNKKGHGKKGGLCSDYRLLNLCIWHHRLGGTEELPGSFHAYIQLSGWAFYEHYGIDAEAVIKSYNEEYNQLLARGARR